MAVCNEHVHVDSVSQHANKNNAQPASWLLSSANISYTMAQVLLSSSTNIHQLQPETYMPISGRQ